jgi:predicted peptidase
MEIAPGSFHKTVHRDVGCRYLLYLPRGYSEVPDERWPVILFLHGAGERGDGLELVKTHGPPRLISEGAEFPFVIIAPQCPKGEWWDPEVLVALLDAVSECYRVDEDRVYVTGLSMGGRGTWQVAGAYPGRFAAVAPICGPSMWFKPGTLDELPVWCFHGAMDNIVPIQESVDMVCRLRECGGHVRLTVYPDAGHDSWSQAYEDDELYDWFLRHKRGAGLTDRRNPGC